MKDCHSKHERVGVLRLEVALVNMGAFVSRVYIQMGAYVKLWFCFFVV